MSKDESHGEASAASTRDPNATSSSAIAPSEFDIDRSRRPSPFPGLRAFGSEDADAAIFYGRERELDEMLERVEFRQEDLLPLVIVAEAGTGKTSLLQAGIVPRLRRKRWIVLTLGRSEAVSMKDEALLERIEEARRSDSTRVAVCVDIPNVEAAPEVLAHWIDWVPSQGALLISTSTPAHLARTRVAGRNFERYDLRPLPRFRLDQATAGPAGRYGVEVDEDLIDALIEDAPEADMLPVMAFVLAWLWSSRVDLSRLELEVFAKAERVRGIVESVCEAALALSDPDGGEDTERDALAAQTFVPALLRLDEDGNLVGSAVAESAFEGPRRALIDRFVRTGLVVRHPDDGTIRAHAALFRLWFRVETWLAPSRERYEAQLRLKAAAAAWQRGGRRDEDLVHLDEATWEASRVGSLLPVEREYLRRCASRRAEGRRRRRRDWTFALAGLALVVLSVVLVNRAAVQARLRRSALNLAAATERFTPLTEAEERALSPGDTFRECTSLCPEMVVIPAGTFVMGDEQEQDPALLPRHTVRIPRPLAVGRTEVTFYQMGALPNWIETNREYPAVDVRKPVNFVTQEDAQAYVAHLSRATGRRYRLLTSSEWEYMARAGSQTGYAWGETLGTGRAHCLRGCGSPYREGLVTRGGFVSLSAPVGSFEPNAFGIHDAHGNVWERVQDCFHPTYVGAPSDGSPRLDPYRGVCRPVIRGGGYSGTPEQLRSAVRDWLQSPRHDVGFRVARDLATPTPN